MKREIKIGIFMTIAIFILSLFIFIVGDISVFFKKKGYPLFVNFDSVAGLEKRAVVRMAGVKVGFVKKITLKETRAEVLLNIDSRVKVDQDSKVTLASLGLLGEKYIEIMPGGGLEFCQPGDVLGSVPSIGFDKLGVLLFSVGDEIKELGGLLGEVIGEGEPEANIKETLQNISSFVAELKDFFGESKGELNKSIKKSSEAIQKFEQGVEGVSHNLDELILLLKSTVEENRENVKINLESIKELILKIEKSLGLLNESLEKINKGEGTLGRLIQDAGLYERTEETVKGIQKMIQPVSSFRVKMEIRADYLTEGNLLKNYLTFGLWPTPEKFLLAQIIRDPLLDKFTYSLQGGIRWGPLVSRAGILESKFGLGVDYYTLHDRLRFSIESFDFNRHPRPNFRIWTRYAASKYVCLLVGIEDFTLAPNRELFFGFSLGF